jgi:hypothetical protein
LLKSARMNDREAQPSRKSAYALVPATSISEDALHAFAAALGPGAPSQAQIRASWWRRAPPDCAVAAVHVETGGMVGLCGGRPCEWIIAGQTVPTLALCDWFVHPAHAGKLIGKRVVQHFYRPDRMVYAIAISEMAVAYLQRLGWVGPFASSLMVAPLPRLSRAALSFFPLRGDFTFSEHLVGGGTPSGSFESLAEDLDHIEARRAPGSADHMRRGASEWAWRMSMCGEHSYRLSIARKAGAPAGYVAVRLMAAGRIPQLGGRQAAMITDFVAVDDDPTLLRALARRALAIAGEMRAVAALAATTNASHRSALAASGFLSPAFPVIGGALARRAPVFMWLPKGPGAALAADHIELTFADAAVDLDL